jgi:hypothetical protein
VKRGRKEEIETSKKEKKERINKYGARKADNVVSVRENNCKHNIS